MIRRCAAAALLVLCAGLAAGAVQAAPACPLSYGATDSAKSFKLYIYMPTADDPSYPDTYPPANPVIRFDATWLDPTFDTAALRDRIRDVVADDYCEFNIQVLATTTSPELLANKPKRRHVIAIGTDAGDDWGAAPTTYADQAYGRVWAGRYVGCEGAGCAMTGALEGANSTLDHWANAVGGTAAHEGGHTYGLNHSDENPPVSCDQANGFAPKPGEDAYTRHLMPGGCNLDGPSRANYRRHFSDRSYGLLASQVGLSVQTLHNWDLVNPNAETATSLVMDVLSSQASLNLTWSWSGPSSPWIKPSVSGSLGMVPWHGAALHHFQISWTTPNPAWVGATPGAVAGAEIFHVGASFTGVDFNKPDPVVIQDVTLKAAVQALALHPRLPSYDTGTIDANGAFAITLWPAAAQPAAGLTMTDAVVYQLPRVAAIETMNGDHAPATFDGQPIAPWTRRACAPAALREQIRCVVAAVSDPPHVVSVHRVGEPGVVDCSLGLPVRAIRRDSPRAPDVDGPICAGSGRDPFPATTVYLTATFVDPQAKHWDPRAKAYVTGPVTSKLFYQFAGVRSLDVLKAGDRPAATPGGVPR
jgi:hypothetical protein